MSPPTRGSRRPGMGWRRAGLAALVAVWAAGAPAGGALAAGMPPPDGTGASGAVADCQLHDVELQLSYAGGCLDGLAHGSGVARGAAGAWYRGGFRAGMKHGQGTKIYPNGDGYTGDWLNDRREGQGRYEYGPDSPWRGDVYQGGWAADQFDGRGVYIFWPSGDRFVAEWQNGSTKTVGTTTVTRRKQAFEVLAPVLGQPGLAVCSITTQGAGPQRPARGVVTGVMGDRLQVRIQTPEVLAHSPRPSLNPRWEVMTQWLPCP